MQTICDIRRLDQQGRLALPIGIRKKLEIEEGTQLEICIDGDEILLKKYEPGCSFCGETKELAEFKGRLICGQCLAQLKKL